MLSLLVGFLFLAVLIYLGGQIDLTFVEGRAEKSILNSTFFDWGDKEKNAYPENFVSTDFKSKKSGGDGGLGRKADAVSIKKGLTASGLPR